ncbi:MAG: HD domain-containing protein [Chitinophagaceae bacterium]|nr:MAG: HD domain-containing protein [Chitinophagaceae bacterium]
MNDTLAAIQKFADEAHGEQKRKYTPERYIVHPVRVMELCSRYTNALPVLGAALLHDVLEDTNVGKKQMLQFLESIMSKEEAAQTTALVVELTDVYTKAAHPRWNRKKRKRKEAERIQKTSADSQTVKYADIIDNCKEIVEHDPDFAGVFLMECRSLLTVMQNGNEELRKEAVTTVDQCLQRVPQKFRRV